MSSAQSEASIYPNSLDNQIELEERDWTDGWTLEQLNRCHALEYDQAQFPTLQNPVHPLLSYSMFEKPTGGEIRVARAMLRYVQYCELRPALQLVSRWLTSPAYAPFWGTIMGETQNQLLALANDADNPLMFITAVFPERWGLTQGATLSHETRQLTHYGGTKSIICLRIDLLERAIYANYSESKSNWLHHIFSLAVCIGHELAHALCSVHHFPLENYEMEAVFPRHVLPELGWSFEHFVLGYIVTALGADSTMHHGSIATKLLSGSSRGKMEVLISPEALRGMQFGSKKTHQTHSYPISCKYMNDLFSEQWWVSMMPSFSRHSCKIPVDENLKRVIMHTHTKIEEDDYGWDGESMVSPVPNTLISNIDVDSELSDEG